MLKMNDRQKNIASHALKVILAIAFGLFCYFLFSNYNMQYETNDDPASVLLLMIEGNYFSPLHAKPMSALVASLYSAYPGEYWWTVITLTTISVSTAVVLYVFLRKFEKKSFTIVAAVTIFAFMAITADSFNFTRTAAASAVAGMLLIILGIEDFDRLKNKIPAIVEVVLGSLIWLWGAMIRDQVALVVIPFAGIYLLYYIISRSEKFEMKEIIAAGKNPLIIAIVSLVCAVGLLFSMSFLYTAEEVSSLEFYKARISVQDYVENYPTYEEATERYELLGVSESDYQAIFKNSTIENPDVFTAEFLNSIHDEMYQLNSLDVAISSVAKLITSETTFTIPALVITLIIMICLSWKKKAWILLLLVATMAYLLFLGITGRVVPRVVDFPYLYLIIFSLLIASNDKKTGFSKNLILFSAAMILFFNFIAYPFIKAGVESYSLVRDYKVEEYDVDATNFYNYISGHDENYYIMPLLSTIMFFPSQKMTPEYTPDIDYFDNLHFLGGWDQRIPIKYEMLAESGIENPMKAIFENPSVFTSYNELADTHLRGYYGNDLSLSRGDSFLMLSGELFGFYQYSKPITGDIKTEINPLDIFCFGEVVVENNYYQAPSSECYLIEGNLTATEAIVYKELYLDIKTADENRSYRLYVKDDNSFYCHLFGIAPDILATGAEVSIIAKNGDGEYIKIQKIEEYIGKEVAGDI